MKAIIVDDEPLMIQKFVRMTEDISDLQLIGQFETAEVALSFMQNNSVDVAFLDVEMPVMDGITLAQKLRDIRDTVVIVFVTAFDEYIYDSNAVGGDYYLVKPYTKESIRIMMEKIRLLAARQNREIFIQMFGRFVVKRRNNPIRLTGKAKEILALIVTRQGREISNEEIFSIVWEDRPYSNANMSVYYNALRRLKVCLKDAEIPELLISTARGQMVNTAIFDCDYYIWKEQDQAQGGSDHGFDGEFLSEYSWGESILADIIQKEYGI